jgi:hypothetical protein
VGHGTDLERFFAEIAAHLKVKLADGESEALANQVLAEASMEDLAEVGRVAVRIARKRFNAC